MGIVSWTQRSQRGTFSINISFLTLKWGVWEVMQLACITTNHHSWKLQTGGQWHVLGKSCKYEGCMVLNRTIKLLMWKLMSKQLVSMNSNLKVMKLIQEKNIDPCLAIMFIVCMMILTSTNNMMNRKCIISFFILMVNHHRHIKGSPTISILCRRQGNLMEDNQRETRKTGKIKVAERRVSILFYEVDWIKEEDRELR